MRNNTRFFILSYFPIFNKDEIPCFENFDKEMSAYLYSALYSNLLEVLTNYGSEVVSLFHYEDEGHLPEQYLNDAFHFFNPEDFNRESIAPVLVNASNSSITVFFMFDSIGFDKTMLNRLTDKLRNEDEVLVIAKSNRNDVTHFGINGALSEDISINKCLDYETMLKSNLTDNRFVQITNSVHSVRSFDDFKVLYRLLSTKENFHYCSLDIHDKFTHLFIEYKDMLK